LENRVFDQTKLGGPWTRQTNSPSDNSALLPVKLISFENGTLSAIIFSSI
jgi:hypothetical protein